MAATLIAAAALLAAAIALGRDPWVDEATLIANFLVDRYYALFSPMPLFEQAAPLGYRLLGTSLARPIEVAGGISATVPALRAVSALGILAMTWAAFRTTRLHGPSTEAAIAAILVSATPFAIHYGTEIKQYALEGAASAVLLYSAARAARAAAPTQALYVFLACATVGYAFSFLLILVVGGCVAGIAATRLAEARRNGEGLRIDSLVPAFVRDNRPLLTIGAAAVGAGLLFYLLYSRAVVVYQLAASPDVYDAVGGEVPGLAAYELIALFFQMLTPLGSYLPGVGMTQLASAGVLAAILLAAWVGCLRRSLFVGACAAALLLGLTVAHQAGLLPFKSARHLLFVLPILACTIALGFGEIAAAVERKTGLRPGRLAVPFFTTLGLAIFAGGAASLSKLPTEEVTPLLRHARLTRPAVPLWVYYAAQPAVRVLADPATVQLGLLDHRSSPEGWSVGGGGRDAWDIRRTSEHYIASVGDALGGHDAAWLIFAHAVGDDERRIVSSVGGNYGPCALEAHAAGTSLYLCSRAR